MQKSLWGLYPSFIILPQMVSAVNISPVVLENFCIQKSVQFCQFVFSAKAYHYWDSCEVEKKKSGLYRQLYLHTSNFVSHLPNLLLWIQDDLFQTSEEFSFCHGWATCNPIASFLNMGCCLAVQNQTAWYMI